MKIETGIRLTPRQKQILELAAQGNSYKEIGNQLFISESTVKTHAKAMMHSNQYYSMITFAIAAAKQGII